jgi:hypothetical protein
MAEGSEKQEFAFYPTAQRPARLLQERSPFTPVQAADLS